MTSLYEQYSKLSLNVTNSLSKDEKKKFGIFISPYVIIDKLFDCIKEYVVENNIEIKKILEPSCGTCEIVNYCDKYMNDVKIDAIELNKTVFDSIKDLSFKNNVNLIQKDFIQFNNGEFYDLVVTNPPYFVCKKEQVPTKYEEYIYGRPNIFGLFIIHSIFMTRPNGILAFIVPKSFLNSLYYSRIRTFIKKTCKIIEIIDFEKDNKFIDTDQATFGLVLQKEMVENTVFAECDYSMKLGETYMFTSDSLILKNIFLGSTTIEKMGLKVRTGQIVWNEHKDILTNDKKETVLIYNTNVTKDHSIEITTFKNDTKFQYIKQEGRTDPILVINRGNGNSKYKLNYAFVDKGPYLIENHLNEIYSNTQIKKEDLMKLYEQITNSFKNPKTQLFIDLFLGNNGLSKTELETIFPIYI